MNRAPRARLQAVLAVFIATGLVATARVILDVHWVSDVVAGGALGAGWTAVCLLAVHWRRSTSANGSISS